MMDVNDWPTRLKGCRTSATGTLRDVLTHASGRTTERRAAYDRPPARVGPRPVLTLASSPVPAPGATPPRREHFLGLDCE